MDYNNNSELLKLAICGDENATAKLMENNLGLVRSIALRFKDRGVEFEDLMQIGSIGMLKAIRSFDLNKTIITDKTPYFTNYKRHSISGEHSALIKVKAPYCL